MFQGQHNFLPGALHSPVGLPVVLHGLWLPVSYPAFPCGCSNGIVKSVSPPVQFSSVTQLCLTLCDLMDCSRQGFPVHHQILELAQAHVHQVGDPLSSSSPPAFDLSQHQGLFQRVSSSHQVAKVLEFQLQHQSFQ